MPEGPVHVIRPAKTIAERLGARKGESHGLDPALLARMEAALGAHVAQNAHLIPAELTRLRSRFAGARADGDFRPVFAASHDIKGLAGTFGYPAVTRFADSLCTYLLSLPDMSAASPLVVATHLDAMTAALESSEDGALVEELAQGLAALVAHAG
ncbi:MAG: Hpt domain-containing protein [Alphaproteobacteria bacterium]|nr:Hpt domain-containing protein [Alphaproteobacteria bacterium]